MLRSLVFIFFVGSVMSAANAQEVLPGITVLQSGEKVIVSWKNEYNKPVAALTIQRSYDSLKNFTTIGSVLNPQNRENGYADVTPPYNKMYYRIFLAFEGGSYIITPSVRPTKDSLYKSSTATIRYPWQQRPREDNNPIVRLPEPLLNLPPKNTKVPDVPNVSDVPNVPVIPAPNFPSKWIYTAKDNNVVLYLPAAANKKYVAVFYDELERKIFELSNLKEEYLIIEKVNFVRSGWYSFQLFENGKLVEKNKFFVPKDGKVTNDPMRKNK